MESIPFPLARRSDRIDQYFSHKISDPFRWLEQTDTLETQSWLNEQDAYMEKMLAQMPSYQRARDHLGIHWKNNSAFLPIWNGEQCFHWEQPEDLPQPILTVQAGGTQQPIIVQDFNQFAENGAYFVFPEIQPSPNGRYLVCTVYNTQISKLRFVVYDLTLNHRLTDHIVTDLPVALLVWHPNESGFFYNRFERETGQGGVYWHRLGADNDLLVCDQAEGAERFAFPYPSGDSEHFLIHFEQFAGARGGWGVRSFAENAPTVPLIDPNTDYCYTYVGCHESEAFFATNFNAPNWRIVAININTPGIENLREVVAAQPEPVAMFAGANEGKVILTHECLLVTYIQHNAHIVRTFDLTGKELGELPLPPASQVGRLQDGKWDSQTVGMILQTYLTPAAAFSCDLTSRRLIPLNEDVPTVDDSCYAIERVFYPSRDGTRIPMTIIHKKDLERDGSHKVLLTGYGGWGVPFLPKYEHYILMWLEWGGVFAAANLRGGNEYGEGWHQAGQLLNKQNTFDDFFAAAEWLVAEKYTSPTEIAITGATGGGLLTAACAIQRPDLFGAVIAEAPVVDLIRFADTPFGGSLVKAELGDPQESQQYFETLLGYSPIHNINAEKTYPPILLVIGEHDRRFAPGQLFKFIAELQSGNHPAILKYFRNTSYDSKNKEQMLHRQALKAAFAWDMTMRFS